MKGWKKTTLLPLVAIMRRSRNFCQGEGGSRPDGQKTAWTTFLIYFSTYCTVYRGGPIVLLQRKLYFSKDPEGVQYFPRGGGSNFFQGENAYNL